MIFSDWFEYPLVINFNIENFGKSNVGRNLLFN